MSPGDRRTPFSPRFAAGQGYPWPGADAPDSPLARVGTIVAHLASRECQFAQRRKIRRVCFSSGFRELTLPAHLLTKVVFSSMASPGLQSGESRGNRRQTFARCFPPGTKVPGSLICHLLLRRFLRRCGSTLLKTQDARLKTCGAEASSGSGRAVLRRLKSAARLSCKLAFVLASERKLPPKTQDARPKTRRSEAPAPPRYCPGGGSTRLGTASNSSAAFCTQGWANASRRNWCNAAAPRAGVAPCRDSSAP